MIARREPCASPLTCACWGTRERVERRNEVDIWCASPNAPDLTFSEWYNLLPSVFSTPSCTCDGIHHVACNHHWQTFSNTGQKWPEAMTLAKPSVVAYPHWRAELARFNYIFISVALGIILGILGIMVFQ